MSRLKISLALLAGFAGFVLAGANLPVDTQLTIRTKLGKRTYPHWLVQPDSKIVKSEGASGLIRLLGGLGGFAGFGIAMHLAGSDERNQRLVWAKQAVSDDVQQKEHQTTAEISAGVRLKKLQLEAQADVDLFSLQLQRKFREAIGFTPAPSQPALPHEKPGTLDEITSPGDKIDDVGEPIKRAIEPEQEPKIPRLTNYPAVLIYGPQGSGKTFFAEEEVKQRKQAGHKVTALDPHAGFYSWRDCEVVGAGMDYSAIDAALAEFASEVHLRYGRIRKEPSPQFQSWTFVCDEFTNWASRCKASGDFFQTAMSDIRKAKMYVIFVSHARTLAGLGDAKGMAATRDAALFEIELLGMVDSKTTEAVPKFEALVKLPGQSQADRKLVKLVRCLTPKSVAVDAVPNAPTSFFDKPSGTPGNVSRQDSEQAGTLDGIRAERLSSMLVEILAGTTETAVFAAESTLEQSEKLELAKLIVGQKLGTEKTIWLLWGIRRGGRNHFLYTEAREMLERLTGRDNLTD